MLSFFTLKSMVVVLGCFFLSIQIQEVLSTLHGVQQIQKLKISQKLMGPRAELQTPQILDARIVRGFW